RLQPSGTAATRNAIHATTSRARRSLTGTRLRRPRRLATVQGLDVEPGLLLELGQGLLAGDPDLGQHRAHVERRAARLEEPGEPRRAGRVAALGGAEQQSRRRLELRLEDPGVLRVVAQRREGGDEPGGTV